MTDTEFEKVITDTAKALVGYRKLLSIAEKEYKKRFGFYPSEIDDDTWIDALHQSGFPLSVDQVRDSVELRNT